MKKKSILSDLDVFEVSFVDKGAIGEKFSVIKMEDPNNCDPELLSKINKSQVSDFLSNQNDQEFVNTMKQLIHSYEQINKGGTNQMNEKEVQEIVQKCINETMSTVNKNFTTINNSVTEIQKAVEQMSNKEEEKEKAEKEKADQKEAEKLKNDVNDVKKSLDEINKALNVVAGMKSNLDSLVELNLKETLEGVTKRLDEVENSETPSQTLKTQEGIQKSAGQKEVFWKSVLGVPDEE